MITGGIVRSGPDMLKLYEGHIPKVPGLLGQAWRKEVSSLRRTVRRLFGHVGGFPAHPFVWSDDPVKNARARRYYRWAVRKGIIPTSNGRYQRTGKHAAGWDILPVIDDAGGLFRAVNTVPGSEFLYGPKQNPSHALSGWPNAEKTITDVNHLAVDRLSEIWHTVTDPTAGVP